MKRLALTLVTLLWIALPATAGAAAYNPLGGACGSGGNAQKSSACTVNGANDPISGPHGTLRKVSFILATFAGIAAVIVIIVGGFRFVTSGGDPQKAASARSTVLGAVVGLAIIAAAEGIITFVLSKL